MSDAAWTDHATAGTSVAFELDNPPIDAAALQAENLLERPASDAYLDRVAAR
jgi:hypothetical protein